MTAAAARRDWYPAAFSRTASCAPDSELRRLTDGCGLGVAFEQVGGTLPDALQRLQERRVLGKLVLRNDG